MRVMLTLMIGCLACSNVGAAVVEFNDFSDVSILDLNGNATTTTTSDGVVLRLTSAAVNQSGSAFSLTTVNAATFSTYFQFRITNPGGTLFDGNTDTGADGIVFVVQSVSSSVGGIGQGIGYSGISHSVGIEFDTWHNSSNNDPDSNHLGIDVNGSVNHGNPAQYVLPIATRFDDGNIWHAWVDYNGTTLEVRTNQTGVRPSAATLSRDLDLPSILGNGPLSPLNTAFIGFTSGTGADWGNHDILAWEYRDSFDPIIGTAAPEPTTIAMWLGVAGIFAGRRRLMAIAS